MMGTLNLNEEENRKLLQYAEEEYQKLVQEYRSPDGVVTEFFDLFCASVILLLLIAGFVILGLIVTTI